MVVTEPFATAYGIEEIAGSIVVDIGAGTTDIARVYGTFPTDEDQVTITEAGDWLDIQLMELIKKKVHGRPSHEGHGSQVEGKRPPTLAATHEK